MSALIKQVTEIADRAELTGITRTAFVLFVSSRFPNSAPSYHMEWAERFKRGDEFTYADLDSRRMLNKIVRSIYPSV